MKNPPFSCPIGDADSPGIVQAYVMEAMEEWAHADDRVIQRSYTAEVCISCAWFTYGMDAHCHTCVGCALMEALLEQGQHLTHGCRNWKLVHQLETGPAVAA